MVGIFKRSIIDFSLYIVSKRLFSPNDTFSFQFFNFKSCFLEIILSNLFILIYYNNQSLFFCHILRFKIDFLNIFYYYIFYCIDNIELCLELLKGLNSHPNLCIY